MKNFYDKNVFKMVWEHFISFLEPKLKILKRFSTHKHIFERKTCRAKNYKIQMKIEIVQIQYWNDFFDTKTKCTFSLLKWLVWNILIIVVISTLFYNREYYIGPYDICCIIDKCIVDIRPIYILLPKLVVHMIGPELMNLTTIYRPTNH